MIMDPSQLPPGLDLAHLPAGRPPPGTSPNFVKPVTSRAPVIAISVIFLTLSTLFVSLRLYTRKFLNRALGLEDCTCLGVTHELLEVHISRQMCVSLLW